MKDYEPPAVAPPRPAPSAATGSRTDLEQNARRVAFHLRSSEMEFAQLSREAGDTWLGVFLLRRSKDDGELAALLESGIKHDEEAAI